MLILSLSRRGASPAPGDSRFENLRQEAWKRDDYTCQYCGFRAERFQEIHFRNHNPQDQSERNVVTACIFCHQVLNVEWVGPMQSGTLIWLPEIDQITLNHIARTIYVARRSAHVMADAARAALSALNNRRGEAEKRLGTSNPAVLASVLRDLLEPEAYKLRGQKLEGIRLMPTDKRMLKEGDTEYDVFRHILAYWRSSANRGPYGKMLPDSWTKLLQHAQETAA